MNFNQKVIRALQNHPKNDLGYAKITFTHTDINYQVWVLELQNHPRQFCITRVRPLPTIEECFSKEDLPDSIKQEIHPHLDIKLLQENLPGWMNTGLTEMSYID